MKALIVLPLLIAMIGQCLHAQNFQEICASENTNGTVVDYQYFEDTLYATGFFDMICGKSVGYIAKWENEEWKPTTINISDPGHALEVIDGQLYIAKYEESIDSNWVWFYNGSSLEKLGEGVYLTTASGFSQLPNIYDVIAYEGKIIACGEFDRLGQQSISGIMQWNGNHWEPMGEGLNGNIPNTPPVMFPHQLLVHDGNLYVGGNFRNAGGQVVNGIAKWDGNEWASMGEGFDNTVYSIAVFNNEIIAGGSFTMSGSDAVNRIARWNGNNWEPLEFGFLATSVNDFIFVHTLKVIDDVLYIGGGLKRILFADNSTEACNGIVAYDGAFVSTFNGGVIGNDIEAIIKIEDEKLLIGGGVFGSGYTGITDISTTVRPPIYKEKAEVYPNPFDKELHISTRKRFKQYELLDGMGNVVLSGQYQENLNLNVIPGIYFLKLINDYTFTTHKLIKI